MLFRIVSSKIKPINVAKGQRIEFIPFGIMVIRQYVIATGLGIAWMGLASDLVLGQSQEPNPLPPESLNRDSELLRVPSQPDSVAIELNQPITLQQAYELALRNSLDLQLAELQLQQSQEVLHGTKAANWPTITATADFSRTAFASFTPNPTPFPVGSIPQQQVQQRTLQNFQTQQLQSQQQLTTEIQQLQIRLQQDQSQGQQQTFDQQIQELQVRANTSANPAPDDITSFAPLSPLPIPTISQGNTSGGINGGADTALNGMVSATYNIFTSGLRSGQIGVAKAQVESAEMAIKLQLEQLRLDVTNDYYNLQQATALISVADDAVRNAQASLQVAQARERAGLGTKFDVRQSEVQLADTVQNATQAQSLKSIAQRQLAQRLNITETANLIAADAVNIAGGWSLTLEKSILVALQNRPELSQILSQRQVAKEQRQIELAANKPQLQAFANMNFVDFLEDEVSGSLGYAVGVQVSINFFDGKAAKSRAAQEEENIAIAETQFADTKNQLRLEVEQAYSNLTANLKNINTAQSGVQLAEESLDLARLRATAGIGTQLDVTTAEASLTQAKGNLVAATLDYNRALVALQRATSYTQPINAVTALGR